MLGNPKPLPYAVVRRRKRLDHDRKLAEAYAEVDRRDAGICAVTGRYTSSSPDPRFRREHHHLKGRRVRPDWVFKPERIITVSAEAHRMLTGHYLDVEGDNATKPIFFHWNRDRMPEGSEPFVISGRRRTR